MSTKNDLIKQQPLTETFIKKIKGLSLPDKDGMSMMVLSRFSKGYNVVVAYDFKEHKLRDDKTPFYLDAPLIMIPAEYQKTDKSLYLAVVAEVYTNGVDGLKNLQGEFSQENFEVISKAADEAIRLQTEGAKKRKGSPLAAEEYEYNLETRVRARETGSEILRRHGINID